MSNIYGGGEGISKWLESQQVLDEQVKIVGDYIILNVANEYPIPLNECNSADTILHWVWHLAEKTWMTQDISRKFIEVACDYHGIKYT